MLYKTILYEKKGQIACVILNRPAVLNAINAFMSQELCQVCRAINDDEEIRSVIVTGVGSFSSGCDLKEPAILASVTREDSPTEAIANLDRVTIAAIGRLALGQGLELALACDIRVASRGAKLGFPHTALGFIPSGGGTQRLPRIVGKAKALEMILTADSIDAEEAYRIGLVNKVVSEEQLLAEAEGIAKRIASAAPIALRYAKEAVIKGLDMTLEQGLRLEADLSILLQTTEDREEGIRAFFEKRPPRFKGK